MDYRAWNFTQEDNFCRVDLDPAKQRLKVTAINKKGDEPIFEVADYGLVSTWEEALPALIEEIEKLKASQT